MPEDTGKGMRTTTADAPRPLEVRRLLTEAVLIAGATAYAYVAAFAYEAGYCDHFDIPRSLIQPNLTNTLIALVAVALFIPAVSMYLGPVLLLARAAVNPKSHPFGQVIWFWAVVAATYVIYAVVYGPSWRSFAITGVLALLFFVIASAEVFAFWRKNTLRDRLAAPRGPDPADIGDLLKAHTGTDWLSVFFLVLAPAAIVYLLGNAAATKQMSFLTLNDDPDVVVLRNYGDLLIAATFDRRTQKVTPSLQLRHIGAAEWLKLRIEEVGPLTSTSARKRSVERTPVAEPPATTRGSRA